MTETMTVQPANGNAAALPHRVSGVPGQGYQRRIDKLVREKHLLRQENDGLREENRELKGLLLQYECTIEQFKLELRKMRGKTGV